jgi:multidrug efflux pump subunit AcrB
MDQAQKAVAGYDKARLILVPPPVIQGIGAAGGYRFMLQDREGRGYDELNKQAWALIGKMNAEKGLHQVYTLFDVGTPRVYADVDRRKADLLGVPPERLRSAAGLSGLGLCQ